MTIRASRSVCARRIFPAFWTAALLAVAAPPALAETAYVSDVLYVPIRTGPSTAYRIRKVYRSGTALQVLERDEESGYARVAAPDGIEGWVEQQYLLPQVIARDQLAAATQEVERLTQTVAELRKSLEAERTDRSAAQQSKEALASQVSRLDEELAEIKRISAAAMETKAANERLTELNARLREEMDALVEQRDRLEDNAEQRWLMIGAGLVLVGLFLGVVIKSRPRRSAWS